MSSRNVGVGGDGRLLLRLRDAARALGVSVNTLRSYTAPKGTIPCVRLGTGKNAMLLYSVDSLRDWIAKSETRAISEGGSKQRAR